MFAAFVATFTMKLSVASGKIYLPIGSVPFAEQAEDFRKLAAFFRSKAESVQEASTAKLLELIDKDLSVGYPYGNAVAGERKDRGGLRCQVWSEKVTRMLQSLLAWQRGSSDASGTLHRVGLCPD